MHYKQPTSFWEWEEWKACFLRDSNFTLPSMSANEKDILEYLEFIVRPEDLRGYTGIFRVPCRRFSAVHNDDDELQFETISKQWTWNACNNKW